VNESEIAGDRVAADVIDMETGEVWPRPIRNSRQHAQEHHGRGLKEVKSFFPERDDVGHGGFVNAEE